MSAAMATAKKASTKVLGTVMRSADGTVVLVREVNDPAYASLIRQQREEIKSSREKAHAFLQEAGILTATGRLTRSMGG